jgi:hypothetical protein
VNLHRFDILKVHTRLLFIFSRTLVLFADLQVTLQVTTQVNL